MGATIKSFCRGSGALASNCFFKMEELADGRLHALEAETGKQLWEVDTITDHKLPYSSTGAVYIADNLAVIGNSGADMDSGGVRGYVSAYDVETGNLKWRFYTVPGNSGKPF